MTVFPLISDLFLNVAATWICALYIVPQVTVFDRKYKDFSLSMNLAGAGFVVALSIVFYYL